MNTTQTQQGSGNWVAFLFGAIFNIFLSITYKGLTEYAVYSIVGSIIGGIVWLVFKIIADKLGLNGDKKNNPIDKLFKRNQNVKH